ncbi:hypothetical protein [Streptomyces sp. S1]|uniref:hypothetical protein n=1 Tax=Streptomyces sp. S1 TaxID=718288 RepID=UPI000EF850E5|nr:hypothetical protein [Streptomyces sp. S1]
MSPVTESQLTSFGLSRLAARVYRHLLDTEPRTPEQLGADLGVSGPLLQGALEQLGSFALLAPSHQADDPVILLDPTAGLHLLASQQQARLTAAVTAAVASYDSYRRTYSLMPGAPTVEVIEQASLQRVVAELERGAVHQVRSFDTAPYGAPTIDNPIEVDNLARGVSYRVLYAQSSVEDAERYQKNILPCIAAGEEARSAPSVPAKMMLVDDRLALVSLSYAYADVHHGALLVHRCSLLPALSALFEFAWRTARPLGPVRGDAGAALRPVDRRLLALLAAGVSDEAAARNLNISKRTLARAVERLMSLAGASSRFQLGLHARAEGWL